jgi:hypothetical protein
MNRIAIGIAAILSATVVQAEIVVKSTFDFDYDQVLELDIKIDGSGKASTESFEFEVSGMVQEKAAFGKTIRLEIAAAKNISTAARTRGDALAAGTINRDKDGGRSIRGSRLQRYGWSDGRQPRGFGIFHQ